jgi:hypothetical protein
MLRILPIAAALFIATVSVVIAEEIPWRAGVARVNITPELPIWLSGYASRNRPATEVLDELWAKALVLEDANGKRALLITMDLVGIDRDLSHSICQGIQDRYKLSRSGIALATTHTHSGPVVGKNLAPMYSLDQRETNRIKNYTEQLVEKVVAVVGEAINDLQPARLAWGSGRATFAVNRRNNPEPEVPQRREAGTLVGPFDHDVPLLAVYDANGVLRAVIAGYACHATVLSDYVVSGDWCGVAQNEFERRHPGVMTMIWAGCGGDQNPVPRRSISMLNQHGRAFADALDTILNQSLLPVAPSLRMAYEEIDLPFDKLPTREELEKSKDGDSYDARYARFLLTVWDRQGGLPASYPYPVQVWQLGDEVSWVILGGEVVVDYALRLKQELGPRKTWVTAYANDVMGYIASRRVLSEGGYEGGGSRIYYGLPAVWHPDIEDRIVATVKKLAGK